MINIDDRLLDQLTEKQYWLLSHIVKRINKDGVCWPSLETIQRDTKWKDWRTVNKVRDELVKMDIIIVKPRMKEEGGRASNMFILNTDMIGVFVTATRLQAMTTPPLHEMQGPPLHEMQPTPLHEMQGEVLTNEVLISSPVSPEAPNRFDGLIDEAILYLNSVAGKNFKPTTKKYRSAINARLREGYSIDDLKQVVDSKFAQWGNDAKFDEYLRPQTLFGTNFDSYLDASKKESFSNTDRQLNDIDLPPEEQQGYADYIAYVIETYNALYRSTCKVMSKRDWHDYRNNITLPGLPFQMTPNEKKKLMTRVHDRLNSDTHFRAKFSSVFECFTQSARAIINQQKPIV